LEDVIEVWGIALVKGGEEVLSPLLPELFLGLQKLDFFLLSRLLFCASRSSSKRGRSLVLSWCGLVRLVLA